MPVKCVTHVTGLNCYLCARFVPSLDFFDEVSNMPFKLKHVWILWNGLKPRFQFVPNLVADSWNLLLQEEFVSVIADVASMVRKALAKTPCPVQDS